MKQFVWSGKLKLIIPDENNRAKLMKKYPSLDLEENNKRYPTKITVRYNTSLKQFLISFEVGDEIMEGKFGKWAGPWKYGSSLLELSEIKFNILSSRTKLHIKGDKNDELFQFFRYNYETMIPGSSGKNEKHKKKTNRKKKGGNKTQKKKTKVYKYEALMYKPSQLKQLDSDLLRKYAKMYNINSSYTDKEIINRFKYIKQHLAVGSKIYNDCLFKDLKKTKNTMDKKQLDKLKKECEKKQLQYYKKPLTKGEY